MTVQNEAEFATVLVVDDTPDNLSLIVGVLKDAYHVKVANSGEKALEVAFSVNPPDIILLDVMMPGMNGYEVCKALKNNSSTRNIPVVFLTALSTPEDERKGLDLGAVDYVTKPISPPILLARLRNHLALRRQTKQLAEWNRKLDERVTAGVTEITRLNRLRRFFSPAVADALLTEGGDKHMQPHRRRIVVVFLDMRGYTTFTETHDADIVMRVLGEFHTAMGEIILASGGTLERFTGDGMMIFFNDPLEVAAPAETAIRMALRMQARYRSLQTDWQARGYGLPMGIGIAEGIATLGAIGFEGRRDYAAIGSVTNLAARLCGQALGGQILVSAEAAAGAPNLHLRPVGELSVKGYSAPVTVFEALLADHENDID